MAVGSIGSPEPAPGSVGSSDGDSLRQPRPACGGAGRLLTHHCSASAGGGAGSESESFSGHASPGERRATTAVVPGEIVRVTTSDPAAMAAGDEGSVPDSVSSRGPEEL